MQKLMKNKINYKKSPTEFEPQIQKVQREKKTVSLPLIQLRNLTSTTTKKVKPNTFAY